MCGHQAGFVGELKQHLASHEAPRFQCGTCGKKCTKLVNLQRHEMLHQEDNPYM